MRELSRPLLVIVSLVAGCLFAALPLMLSRFMSTAADAAVRVAYVTAPPAEAPKLAKAIVHARLAACVNIVPAVVSVYEWEGEMNEDTESLMVIKTRESLQNDLIKFVNENHSYDVPEVIFLPVTAGSEGYLSWVHAQTTPKLSPSADAPAHSAGAGASDTGASDL